MVEELYERLARAVTLEGDDAAIRITAAYRPAQGSHAKVFPPTYMESDGTKYVLESRWDGETLRKVVLLDSVQSQAGRAEAALDAAAEDLGLPRIVLRASVEERVIEISNLTAPHRSRDAYFLDSEVDGVPFDKTEVGRALARATAQEATPFLRYSPNDLVYGVWDSHRGRRIAVKVPRSYTSEMIGWDPEPGKRAATKGDPLNLPGDSKVPVAEWRADAQTKQKKAKDVKLSELGHGMIPSEPDATAGGVSVTGISRQAVLSFPTLAGLSFPLDGGSADVEGRVVLAALALVGDRLAFSGPGIHLRSGSDLVLESDRVAWVGRGGEEEPIELTAPVALDLLSFARRRLAEVGVSWEPSPFIVTPTDRLARVIEQTFTEVVLEPGD